MQRSGRVWIVSVALTLAACGDAPPSESVPSTSTSDAPPPVRQRAAKPAAPKAKAPRSEALTQALAVLDTTTDDTQRASARAVVLASGAAGIDALAEWLTDDDDGRRGEALALLPGFGIDGIRAIAASLDGDAPQERTDAALEALVSASAIWICSDAAAEIARAAWGLPKAADGDPRISAFRVAVAPGELAAFLAPEILERCRSEDGGAWLEALAGGSSRVAAADLLRSSAADLLTLLATDDDSDAANVGSLLAAMRDPPTAAIDEVLRLAADETNAGRVRAVQLAAAWCAEDPRCAELARRSLASPDSDVRRAVLLGWEVAPSVAPDDFVAGAKLVADPDVWTRARDWTDSVHAYTPGVADAWTRALDGSGGADAVALCQALERLHADQIDAQVPSLLRLAASANADVAVAAFRALDTASWETHAQVAALGLSRLDAEDPRVRAWAARFACYLDEPPETRIAAVAKPLFESGLSSRERAAALGSLEWTDEAAARDVARRLLLDEDDDVRRQAEDVLDGGDAHGAVPPEVIAQLTDRLRRWDDRELAFRMLLRVDGGRDPALAWLDEWLAGETPLSKTELLTMVVENRSVAQGALPSIRRLLDRPDHRAAAEIALAAMEPDDDEALRRLAASLGGNSDNNHIGWSRLIDLGPRGAALVVRRFWPRDAWDVGRWIVKRQHDAVVAEIAALATSKDASERRRAATWTAAIPAGDALPVLRGLCADDADFVHDAAFGSALDIVSDDAEFLRARAAWSVAYVNGTPNHRWRAIVVLADTEPLPDGALAALCAAVADTDEFVRAAAAAALILHGDTSDSTMRAAVAMLRAPNEAWPTAEPWNLCARALARLGPRAAPVADVLPRALSVAREATPALLDAVRAMGPAAAGCVPTLRALVRDQPWYRDDTTIAAFRALGAIGAAAKSAVPDIRRAARTPALRQAADDAIRAIEAATR